MPLTNDTPTDQANHAGIPVIGSALPPDPYEFEIDGAPCVATPPGWEIRDLSERLANPLGIKHTVKFCDLRSFTDYVQRFKEPGTAVFLQETGDAMRLTAFLDYHEPSADNGTPKARWCRHVATYTSEPRAAWRAWKKADEQFQPQADFADFLYQNRAEVLQPGGAELLEIVQTLKATSRGEFRETRSDHTGSHELIYSVAVSASAGTQHRALSIPEQFEIAVEPFYGCPAIRLMADLRIRAPARDGERLMLGFRFYRLADVMEDLLTQIAEDFKANTGVPVWR